MCAARVLVKVCGKYLAFCSTKCCIYGSSGLPSLEPPACMSVSMLGARSLILAITDVQPVSPYRVAPIAVVLF